ncbi:AarF/ABC1/UbiB kinase family protein, partial [Aeromicrobium fastidiosum]|nr:AarF/ABC1/UbiB kinase family protein [Aeromicrobium fastidiosum]
MSHDAERTVPPLPRVDLLIRGSARLAEIPGLTEQALRWHHDAVDQRAVVAREARRLSTPRVWPDTIASLATTGWRIVSVAAPAAPFQLLAAASAAVGLRV